MEKDMDIKEDGQAHEAKKDKGPFEQSQPEQEKMIELKESELDRLKQEAAQYKDKYIRLYAEFENVRKRMEREKIEFFKYANEGLIAEFLNLLDDLERSVSAIQVSKEADQAFFKGIQMIMTRLYEMLKRNGVSLIEAKGKMFDPHFHEVLMQEETQEHEDGMVLEEFQKGYMFHDKVLRTVKVKVAKCKK